jgi:UDP-N-acetyl-D-glucosamine dehydrogenase
MHKNLKNLIIKKKSKIGIFGLGYVGLPLALRFLSKKFNVFGFDINRKKINSLKRGKSYINNIPSKIIKKNILSKKLTVSKDFNNVKFCDILIFCLPTPLTKNNNPDLSYLKNNLKKIEKFVKKGQLFSNESTSYPGTTEEYFLKLFKKKKFLVGKDVFLTFSPEREDPGNKKYNISNIPKVISGKTDKCLSLSEQLYKKIVKKVHKVKNIKTAEMTKLLENTFRSVNIGFVNEMKIICNKMGIDIWEVIEAATSKPFGYFPFEPGPGVGGHCIPIDPFYLTWKAKKMNTNVEFANLASKINERMPFFVSKIINKNLNQNKKNKIILLGMAYKPNVDDYRESSSLKILKILKKNFKYKVDYNDPYIPFLKTKNIKLQKSKKLIYKNLKNYDATIILTNHDEYDYSLIKKYSNMIVDTRGVYKETSNKIIKS